MDKKKRKREEKKERGRERERAEKERERKGKRGFRFSLRYTKIGLSVFIRARGKIGPRNEGYAWVPKFWSFVKPQEVENFPTLIIFNLKAI